MNDIKYARDEQGKFIKKENQYDLTGEYGICYTKYGNFIFDLEDYEK